MRIYSDFYVNKITWRHFRFHLLLFLFWFLSLLRQVQIDRRQNFQRKVLRSREKEEVWNWAIAFEIVWPFRILPAFRIHAPIQLHPLCLYFFSSRSLQQFFFFNSNSKFINEWWLSVWWSFASNVLAWLLAAAAFVLYLIACQADLVCLLTRMRWMTAKGEINAFGAISTFSNYRKGSVQTTLLLHVVLMLITYSGRCPKNSSFGFDSLEH